MNLYQVVVYGWNGRRQNSWNDYYDSPEAAWDFALSNFAGGVTEVGGLVEVYGEDQRVDVDDPLIRRVRHA